MSTSIENAHLCSDTSLTLILIHSGMIGACYTANVQSVELFATVGRYLGQEIKHALSVALGSRLQMIVAGFSKVTHPLLPKDTSSILQPALLPMPKRNRQTMLPNMRLLYAHIVVDSTVI